MNEKRLTLMMKITNEVEGQSTCARTQVGCLITNLNMTQILAYGYNGNFRRGPNQCDQDVQGSCGCIHAETNALIKAPYAPGELILFVTKTPCLMCAKLILNAQICKVIFSDYFRDRSGIELLFSQGIYCKRQEIIA